MRLWYPRCRARPRGDALGWRIGRYSTASCSCCMRDSVGRPAAGAGLRQWHELLASPAGVAASGCLGTAAPCVAGTFAAVRPDRLEPGKHRWGKCCQPPGGQETGPNPTDRGKSGSKRHLIVDRRGVPLVLMVSGANRHDSTLFEPLVDALPAITGLRGRPRCRPDKLHADKG